MNLKFWKQKFTCFTKPCSVCSAALRIKKRWIDLKLKLWRQKWMETFPTFSWSLWDLNMAVEEPLYKIPLFRKCAFLFIMVHHSCFHFEVLSNSNFSTLGSHFGFLNLNFSTLTTQFQLLDFHYSILTTRFQLLNFD